MDDAQRNLYINQLCGQSGISSDDFKKTIVSIPALQDKKEINKLFFAFLKNRTKPTIGSKKALAKKATTIAEQALAAEKRSILAQIKDKNHDLNYWFDNIKKVQKSIDELNKRLVKPAIDFESEIKKIIEQGFWINPRMTKDSLSFTTANEVICQDVRPGVNKTLNLGKYTAKLNLKSFGMSVTSQKFKHRYDNRHPYVSSSGGICFGDSSDTFDKYRRAFDIEKMFRLLASLLTTHTGGGFSGLADFEKR
jgi:hypothetical protein